MLCTQMLRMLQMFAAAVGACAVYADAVGALVLIAIAAWNVAANYAIFVTVYSAAGYIVDMCCCCAC